MSEWKEPTDFSRSTVEWEQRREDARSQRLKHYSEYQSQASQKSLTAQEREASRNHNRRMILERARKEREAAERLAEKQVLRETLSKKRALMEKYERVSGKTKEKKLETEQKYKEQLRSHQFEVMQKAKEKAELINQEKKVFTKVFQEKEKELKRNERLEMSRQKKKQLLRKKLEQEKEGLLSSNNPNRKFKSTKERVEYLNGLLGKLGKAPGAKRETNGKGLDPVFEEKVEESEGRGSKTIYEDDFNESGDSHLGETSLQRAIDEKQNEGGFKSHSVIEARSESNDEGNDSGDLNNEELENLMNEFAIVSEPFEKSNERNAEEDFDVNRQNEDLEGYDHLNKGDDERNQDYGGHNYAEGEPKIGANSKEDGEQYQESFDLNQETDEQNNDGIDRGEASEGKKIKVDHKYEKQESNAKCEDSDEDYNPEEMNQMIQEFDVSVKKLEKPLNESPEANLNACNKKNHEFGNLSHESESILKELSSNIGKIPTKNENEVLENDEYGDDFDLEEGESPRNDDPLLQNQEIGFEPPPEQQEKDDDDDTGKDLDELKKLMGELENAIPSEK